MKLTKLVSELRAGDVFYVGSSDQPFKVVEVEQPEMKVFNFGLHCDEVLCVTQLLSSDVINGWDTMPANETVRIVTQSQYEKMKK